MNDEDLKDYGVLAVSEPYARMIDGKVVTSPRMHSNWTRILPTHASDGPGRSVRISRQRCFDCRRGASWWYRSTWKGKAQKR
ncbi:hypothetical protein HRG_013714 [Hirsutella rhossiliensis]